MPTPPRSKREREILFGSLFVILTLAVGFAVGGIQFHDGGLRVLGAQVVNPNGSSSSSTASAKTKPTTTTTLGDTTPPPVPVITSGPDNPTDIPNAAFSFSDAEAGVVFECNVDNGKFDPCASPASYSGLKEKEHTFAVRAFDAAGNRSAAATATWTIVKKLGFTITGQVDGLLYPGVERPVNLSFANPYNFAISIDAVSVTINSTTSARDCSSTDNFAVGTQKYSGHVIVPANSTFDLESDVPALRPTVRMVNLDGNQDACKNVTIGLSFLATATKP